MKKEFIKDRIELPKIRKKNYSKIACILGDFMNSDFESMKLTFDMFDKKKPDRQYDYASLASAYSAYKVSAKRLKIYDSLILASRQPNTLYIIKKGGDNK